ncbi:MAG: transcription antitermination factor NusB [Oscillospiraceae bacterium]|nr:transcription antitermination factor NusB [Oscillospiraceae bacterium]
MTRKEAREQAFIIIFEKSFNNDATIEDIIANAAEARDLLCDEYINTVVNGVFDNLEVVDNSIKENLTKWTIDRLSKVALALLRLSVYEMMFMEDIPNGVSINEAVELCKNFATKDDSAYINGVLGTIEGKLGK